MIDNIEALGPTIACIEAMGLTISNTEAGQSTIGNIEATTNSIGAEEGPRTGKVVSTIDTIEVQAARISNIAARGPTITIRLEIGATLRGVVGDGNRPPVLATIGT